MSKIRMFASGAAIGLMILVAVVLLRPVLHQSLEPKEREYIAYSAPLRELIPTLETITATPTVYFPIPGQQIVLDPERTIVFTRTSDGSTAIVTNQGGGAVIRINCGKNQPTVESDWLAGEATYYLDEEQYLVVEKMPGSMFIKIGGQAGQEALAWEVSWGPGFIQDRPKDICPASW